MKEKRESVVAKLKELQTECTPILRLLENQDLVKRLRQDKLFNAQYLEENYGVSSSTIDALYRFAKFQFDCGNYSGAADFLFQYRTLSNDQEKNFRYFITFTNTILNKYHHHDHNIFYLALYGANLLLRS